MEDSSRSQASKETDRRSKLLREKFADAKRVGYAPAFIGRVDMIYALWIDLKMGDRNMRYEDHVRARELKRLLYELVEETIK